MNEELLKQVEKRLETMQESIRYQISSLCELASIVDTVNYLLFLATHEKSKIKDLKME
jgi:hypothetical protein